MPMGKNPKWCPGCHANVYPDNNGYCYWCDTMTEKQPEHRRRWAARTVRNESNLKKLMDFYWEKGEGSDG